VKEEKRGSPPDSLDLFRWRETYDSSHRSRAYQTKRTELRSCCENDSAGWNALKRRARRLTLQKTRQLWRLPYSALLSDSSEDIEVWSEIRVVNLFCCLAHLDLLCRVRKENTPLSLAREGLEQSQVHSGSFFAVSDRVRLLQRNVASIKVDFGAEQLKGLRFN
jgi:hypothetical protein